MKFLKGKDFKNGITLKPHEVKVNRYQIMKANYNRKSDEITVRMSVADYLNLQRTMRSINGSGEGFVSAESCEICSTLSRVTTLVFDDEVITSHKLPTLYFGKDGRPTFRKGGK